MTDEREATTASHPGSRSVSDHRRLTALGAPAPTTRQPTRYRSSSEQFTSPFRLVRELLTRVGREIRVVAAMLLELCRVMVTTVNPRDLLDEIALPCLATFETFCPQLRCDHLSGHAASGGPLRCCRNRPRIRRCTAFSDMPHEIGRVFIETNECWLVPVMRKSNVVRREESGNTCKQRFQCRAICSLPKRSQHVTPGLIENPVHFPLRNVQMQVRCIR